MSDTQQLAVYPNDATRKRIRAFQDEYNLSKSKAATKLIEKGLDAHESGIHDWLYWELAKISGIVGLLFLMQFALTDGGAIPVNMVYISFVFIAASFVFMVADRWGRAIRSSLPGGTDVEEEPAGG